MVFPTLVVLVSMFLWLRYFLSGSGVSVFNNLTGFFFQEFVLFFFFFFSSPTCVNLRLHQWVLQFKCVVWLITTWLIFLPPLHPQACYQVFPGLSIRNISSFPHCPSHCISYPSKYLSFRLKSLFNWFSHRACSVSLLILVALPYVF